ncbi:type II secretion system protein [Moritella yayanosii]|uniref:Prepilin-type cleavage/methylation domain-containing protein n=1 Tax=Moritella yayanosii TaxID=69539 RepID=A0A330LTE0_9GAMM|nr:type II secretion system protein [Moritella yayanosii]SQD79682.1 Prepilin-type cleavage/methylation domain-containing protein [Moritella yayanosii]
MFKKSGFTLIELVIVIILLGILAATAIPKFIGNNGFETQTYRDQLLQLLKTVQQQAMSCDDDCRKNNGEPRTANPYACNRVVIITERFGIPTNCGTRLPTNFPANQLGMSVTEANSANVNFSVSGTANISTTTLEFDSWGIVKNCTLGCDISIIGDQTLTIRIESQGYIHEQ